MPLIKESPRIDGVYLVQLRPFGDQRGALAEIFRKEWFPDRSWAVIQSNRSESEAGVLRGLHYHHHQVDYWHVVYGSIRAGLVDLRKSSPTRGNNQVIELNHNDYVGLYIPSGVAHGFYTITKATLIYIVDSYYDGSDEFGVAWNDPDIGINWGIDAPNLSQRDAANPPLRDVPDEALPS